MQKVAFQLIGKNLSLSCLSKKIRGYHFPIFLFLFFLLFL